MLTNTRISATFRQLLIVCCVLVLASRVYASYKLNVPKVLLPFHSSKLISFTLEAKSETDAREELCFNWSSSRPDIVAISPIYNDAKTKCSSKAVVSAVSKHPQRFTSIIFAQETKTDKLIRCDVIVDQIDSIRIKHTTTHLYLEDSPECFTAEALDDEGNTFSSIDGLAFEWNVINELSDEKLSVSVSNSLDSRNVLRISKFIDSEYEMSESIKQLESVGLTGHKILIEGLKTGTANVQAKLIDTFYKDQLRTPLVRLLVVANILLEPSYPVYLLQGGVIKYNVFLIKQTSVERINLPQSQYYFESRNSTIADMVPFDKSASTMIGLALGTVQIVLVDRNMKEELLSSSSKYSDQSQVVPPPSATIHVVEPDYLVFTIKNWRSWILEVGRRYEIVIQVYSTSRVQIYPSDNLLIEAYFEPAKFDVNIQSRNGSYNYLTAIRRGVTQARALLKGTYKVNQADQLANYDWVARGEQEIELLDPIDVRPRVVIFALTPAQSSPYEYKLTATGGSGNYHWQSRNTSIAGVNNQGLIRTTASRLGHTQILITDARNQDISAKSNVYVLEPVDVSVQSCPVETQVNSKLYVNIQMNAHVNAASLHDDDLHILGPGSNTRLMPINDCSRLKFDIQIRDESVFKFVSIESPSSLTGTTDACAVIVLDALKVGRTMIKVTALTETPDPVELKSNEMYVGSYSELKSVKHQLTLSERSSYVVHLFDGPLLSSSLTAASSTNPLLAVDTDYKISTVSYESETSVSEPDTVTVSAVDTDHKPNRYSFRVTCLRTFDKYADAANNFVTVRLSVSHRRSHVNKCPLPFDVRLKVRCAEPHSLELSQLFVNNEENTHSGNVLSSLKWKCPIKLSARLITAHHERPLLVQTVVRDSLNNPFDNFTSLPVEWTVENKNVLEKSRKHSRLQHVQVAKNDDSSLVIVADDSIATSNILYYQTFTSKSPLGGSTRLTGQLGALTSTLSVNFVSDVKVKPESLTVFNHPSNVISLGLLDGSGYYQAEIETINMDPSTSFNPKWDHTKPGNVLKINQISESSVVISPLVNNGLTYLHIYDYCVPPKSPITDGVDPRQRTLINWPPYATAKIQVAGINSILADYEDDKLEVSNRIRIYVQISDATGNMIKTKYFPLMNLNAKLSNVDTGSSGKNDPIATVELAPPDLQLGDYTAVYVLNAHKVGLVSVQFEANSDGYTEEGKPGTTIKIIQSGLKEIQVYSPLVVQPKYVELIRGAEYQLIISGGPTSVDSTIKYEITDIERHAKNDRIIEIESWTSVVKAFELGKVKVTVKAVGTACQPFSATSSASSSRCSAENTVERVYSQDQLVVNVVELHSINLHTPLRSVKKGNEMPVYLMGNEKKLSPLNFASCASLKYSWKINDQQIASLHHVLLLPAAGDAQKTSQNADEFEKSVSLRLVARNAGTVKITARVEFKNSKNQLITLSDTIDILVFDDAYFTNLPMSYFKPKQSIDVQQYDAQILMSPGTQFQLQTNYDKKAVRINYELKFYKQFFVNYESNKPSLCENSTIRINSEGLITVSPMKQSQLKHLQECTASVLVTIYQNEHHKQVKHQTLVYTVKVKPVVYSMLRLVKNSLYKSSDVFNTKLRIDQRSLVRNKLQLSDASVEMKWHVCYFDNLGDMFDVVSLTNVYAVNRNDLLDFSNLNANVFVSLYSSSGKLATEDKASGNEVAASSITLLADAAENSFTLRTIKPGTYLMELGIYEGGLHDFKDYIGLNVINEKVYDANLESIEKKSRVDTNVGDLICLNKRSDSDEVECAQTVWSSESSETVRLIPLENQAHLTIGVCMSPGLTFVKKSNAQVDASISALIEINVRPFDRVKFLPSKSSKHLTNADVESTRANLVHFQVGQNPQPDLNCSAEFELLFSANRQSNINELVPFKCAASIYGQNGKRLDYLDRLFVSNIVFVDQQWACEIRFASNSAPNLYDLLDSHQADEPSSLRLIVDSKQADVSLDDYELHKSLTLPFLPAFYVSTKQIELTVFGNTIRRKQQAEQENHVHLTVHSTSHIQPHILVSSNCPTLLQIKQVGTEATSIGYDITATDEILDLTGYASLLQQLNGDLHLQVTCSLTQQVQKIPVKFLFAFGSDASRLDYRIPPKTGSKSYQAESTGYFYNLIGWIFDYSPNQFTTFCIMISITLLTILVILRLKSPTSTSAAEQIALNASAAAAAALTGSAYRQSPGAGGGNIRNFTSFNPYRYFTQSVDANNQLDYSRLGTSPGFPRSPKPNASFNDSFSTTSQQQSGQSRSPRLFDKDNIRLYSVDSTVSQRSPRYQDDTFQLPQRFTPSTNRNLTYRNMDNSYSDNE